MSWLRLTPVSSDKQRLVASLFDATRRPLYVVGRNKYAECVAGVLEVDAFVDDYTDQPEFLARPVVRMNSLPPDGMVISCVVDCRPLTALRRIHDVGVRRCIDYFTLVRLAPQLFLPTNYSAHNVSDILDNEVKYRWLHQRLADDASRRVLEQLTQFRLNWDLAEMAGFVVDPEGQYFESFIRFGTEEVFVDGGGYDGETTRGFVSRCPDYDRIYFFEPNPPMMILARQTLKDVPNTVFVAKGLSDQSGVASFNADLGPASRLTSAGSLSIPITTLDAEVPEAVTFIKLDIEGAECQALAGARGHVIGSRPKLAVAVYHDQRDFWRVPEMVLGMHDGYQVRLRHYTEGPLETIMYFEP